MCLIVKDTKKDENSLPEPYVAEKDILVFKAGMRSTKEHFNSYYFNYKYTAGEDNPEVNLGIELGIHGTPFIFNGYHAYISESELKVAVCRTYVITSSAIADFLMEDARLSDEFGMGYRETAEYKSQLAILKHEKEAACERFLADCCGVFVIPKGSKYYIGTDGDIASSNIMYIMPYSEWSEGLVDAETLVIK